MIDPADRIQAVQTESSVRLGAAARLAGFIAGMGLTDAFLESLDHIPSEPDVDRALQALLSGGGHV